VRYRTIDTDDRVTADHLIYTSVDRIEVADTKDIDVAPILSITDTLKIGVTHTPRECCIFSAHIRDNYVRYSAGEIARSDRGLGYVPTPRSVSSAATLSTHTTPKTGQRNLDQSPEKYSTIYHATTDDFTTRLYKRFNAIFIYCLLEDIA
jgi:hypothetical protein